MDQRGREWRIEELTERARRRPSTEGEAAPVFRHELAERTDHHRKRAAGKTEADQHSGRKVEFYERRRLPHPGKPRRIEDRAEAEHPHRTKAVGDCPCKWLRRPPEKILYGDRQRERLAAPAAVERQRREELTERRARTERESRSARSVSATVQASNGAGATTVDMAASGELASKWAVARDG